MTGSSTKQAGAPGVRSGTQLSSQGGTTMTGETISATTIINARPRRSSPYSPTR